MRKIALYLLPALALSVAACGKNEGPKPAASAKASAAATTAKAKKPEKKKDAVWDKYPGPKVKADIGDAKKVWCVLPVSTGFNSVKFGYKNVVKNEGEIVVVDGYVPAHVPGAFVKKPLENKDLKKGMAVMVDEAAAGPMGRVVEVGKKIKYKYKFASSVSDGDAPAAGVWPLTGKLDFAAPVAYKDGGKWKWGRVGYTAKDKTWVVPNSGGPKQIDTSALKVIDVNTIYKKGDTVWAVKFSELRPAKVTEVLEGGVAYKVKFDKGGDDTLVFAKVSKPLE